MQTLEMNFDSLGKFICNQHCEAFIVTFGETIHLQLVKSNFINITYYTKLHFSNKIQMKFGS